MAAGDPWATVELSYTERDGLRDGAIIERLIEQRDERCVDVLEMEWHTRGTMPQSDETVQDAWPHLFDGEPITEGKSLAEVYEDRNLLACALAVAAGPLGGWTPDPDSPEDWAIVFIETPYGQASWHVPREMADNLCVRRRDEYEWDGHDRERKNDVLATWVKDGCPR